MRTQWVQGPGGPSGLNYTVMHHKMSRMNLAPEEYDRLESDIQIMEAAAIGCIYEKS